MLPFQQGKNLKKPHVEKSRAFANLRRDGVIFFFLRGGYALARHADFRVVNYAAKIAERFWVSQFANARATGETDPLKLTDEVDSCCGIANLARYPA